MVGARVVLALIVIVGCSKAKETGTAASGSAGSSAGAPVTAGLASPGSASESSAPGSAAAATTGAAPAAGSAAATGSDAPEGYKVGDAVYGRWTDGSWYPGKIAKINDDGTYRVNYNDGDVSPSLPSKKIKPRKSSGGAATGRSTGKGGSEPCPASHWTRCGNNCVPLMDDRYNCGRCGNVCPSNMSLCRNGVCDCTGVEKDSNGGVCPS